MVITSSSPSIVSRNGGDNVVLTGVFPQGMPLYVTVSAPDAKLYQAMSGVAGNGRQIYSYDGKTLSIFLPNLRNYATETAFGIAVDTTDPLGAGYVSAAVTLASAFTIRPDFFATQVYALRSVLPLDYATGPRSIENEDPPS
jgi:hypothetical protein